MLQNKQGHIKKPNCLSLFFFINCDFVLNLGEKCIWEWRGKWSCFLVIIFLMRERSDLDALPSVAVLFSSGLSMLCGTNVPHQCFSLVIGHYGKRKKTSVLMGANPCSATIYLQFSWLTYLWHLFIFQEFRTINTDFFFFLRETLRLIGLSDMVSGYPWEKLISVFTKAADQYMGCFVWVAVSWGSACRLLVKEEHKVNNVFPSPECSLDVSLLYANETFKASI